MAEADIGDVTENPRGVLHVAAPLGVGRSLIAPNSPASTSKYPLVDLRLRLSDRKVDLTAEGLDIAFFLGHPTDSNLRIRKIADCPLVLCARPEYIAKNGHPVDGFELQRGKHNCLMLRFPGSTEFQWELNTPDGLRKFDVKGRLESDDGDVLTDRAFAGAGIAMKPVFEVYDHLKSGKLIIVAEKTRPSHVQMACL